MLPHMTFAAEGWASRVGKFPMLGTSCYAVSIPASIRTSSSTPR
jgi:hypothetical protein